MSKWTYPKVNIYTKKQLAHAISGGKLPFHGAERLIDECLLHKDEYWKDNLAKSEPEHDKWVRSAFNTPLDLLLKRINNRVLAKHDDVIPPFIHGGVGGRCVKSAAESLLGSKRKRILLKMDISRFFEHISYCDVVNILRYKCKFSKEVASIIAELSCVELGQKSINNNNKKVIARGFSTSSRLAIWCNLDLFIKVFNLVNSKLKNYDPRMAIYMDDIGITASRVDLSIMTDLYDSIENLVVSNGNLRFNAEKTKIIDHLCNEYDVSTGNVKNGVYTSLEFLGIRLNRNSLSCGIKTRSKYMRLLNKNNLTRQDRASLKGIRRYNRYIRANSI